MVITAILLTLLVLSQISGSQASPRPKEASPAGLVEVIGPWFGSEMDAFVTVLDAFEAETGVATTYIPMRAEDLLPILDTQFAVGDTPADVIFMSPGFIQHASQESHVVHVNHLIDEAGFLPGALDPVKVGDTIYGGAYTGFAKPGFWYRQSFFDAHGLTVPTTYAEFVALLGEIAAISGIANPIVSGDGVGWPLSDVTEHFLATYGGAEMHRDLIAGTLSWTDPSVRSVFNDRLVPLLQEGYFSSPVEWTAAVQDWWNGDYGLYFMGSWIIGMVPDPNDLGVFALPPEAGVSQGIVFAGTYLFIPVYTGVLGEAKLLFQFLAGAEGQAIQVQQGGHIATALGVPLDNYPAGEREVAALMVGREVLSDLDDVIGGEFQTTFWSQLQLLWADPASLDSVLATLQSLAPTPDPNSPPAASFTVSPSAGDVTTTFTVDASSSSDAEDPSSALEVRWDWEDDGIWDTPWSPTKTAQHQYADPDTYTVRLEVKDTGRLTDQTTRQVDVASTGGCVTPPSGLISWWPGDGNAMDVVGPNDGTPLNGATFVTGYVGQAFSFDGVDDVVLASGTGINDLQSLTIDAWVRLDSMPSGQIERFVTLVPERAVLRYDGINGPKQLHFFMEIDAILRHIRVNDVLQAGVFHHVAGTYDGTTMRLYLDGAEVGNLSISGTVGVGTGVRFSDEPLDGLLDEVEIFNRALSAAEILDIYDAGSAGKCNAPPATTAAPSGTTGQAGWFISSVVVTLTAVDDLNRVASTSYRIDGESWQEYVSPFTVDDGVHTVEYFSTDNAGNAEDVKSIDISIDATVPETFRSVEGTLGENGWYTSALTVTLAASDATSGVATIVYRIDGG
ncbi:MAG: extracellular solute-binding protein, partial [Thermoplasmata archaeon]